MLGAAGLGTLLVDLLTGEEEPERRAVFDIPLLVSRPVAVTSWLRSEPQARRAALG